MMSKELFALIIVGWILLVVGPVMAFGAEPNQPFSVMKTDVETAIADALTQENYGEHMQVSIQQQMQEPVTHYQNDIKAYVHALDVDTNKRKWKARLVLEADGRPMPEMNLSGSYTAMKELPTLLRVLERNDIIRSEDITMTSIAADRVRGSMVTDKALLIGKAVSRTISPGRPIRTNEVSEPSIVEKGKPITLTYRIKNMEITALGEALDNGAVGDIIRIKNQDSGRTVQAVVRASGEAEAVSANTQLSSVY